LHFVNFPDVPLCSTALTPTYAGALSQPEKPACRILLLLMRYELTHYRSAGLIERSADACSCSPCCLVLGRPRRAADHQAGQASRAVLYAPSFHSEGGAAFRFSSAKRMIVVPMCRGHRIEVNAVAVDCSWNAEVRIRRTLSSDKPHNGDQSVDRNPRAGN